MNSINTLDAPPIYCKPVGDNLEHVEAMIVGPSETPYEFGFFHFDMKFSNTYPDNSPQVHITTTDGGKTRMNPNLYAGGKVCLSILGTWSGESEDEWRSSYSINYILRAIQSLILTSKPYHNEPGYQEINSEYAKPEEVQLYTDKIKHESLRIAVCGVLEDILTGKKQNQFGERIKNYFLLWFDIYVKRALEEEKKDGTDFAVMPFEYNENSATGKFNYTAILQRLKDIKGKIDKETIIWKENGHLSTKAETGWKYLKMLEEREKIKKGSQKELEGISAGPVTEDNLFYWNASIFGPDGTPWEGGIYNLELVFSNVDLDAPPRIRFLTEMWHPHITLEGTPYFHIPPSSKDIIIPVLLAVQKLLKVEPNSSSASWVNLDAANQCFSKSEDERKLYKKKVSQCAKKSVE